MTKDAKFQQLASEQGGTKTDSHALNEPKL